MASSKSKRSSEPPQEKLVIAPAAEHETLDECLKEMKPCDQTATIVPKERKYIFPTLITDTVRELYSAVQETSARVAATSVEIVAYLRETMAKGYDFELLKSFFKKQEPGKDPLQKAPEGGDDSGKVAYAFLQRMKNYVSHEVAEIFRWNGYRARKEKQPPLP